MKSKKYLILTIVVITGTLIYGSLNKIQTSIENYESTFVTHQINNFNKESDKFYIEKKDFSTNLLFSKGILVVVPKIESDIYETKFLLKYTIHHNFFKLFLFDELPLKVNLALDGNIKKTLKTENLQFSFNGNINTNGDIKLDSKENRFSLILPKPEDNTSEEDSKTTTGMKVDVGSTNFSLNYNKKENLLKVDTSNLEIFAYDLEDKEDNIKINNFNFNYASNLNDPNVGSLTLKVSTIKDGIGNINIDNFNLNTGIELQDDGYKILFASKVDTFEIMDQKKSRIDIKYSIRNLNKSMMKFYKDFTSKYAVGDEISSEDILEAKNAIINNLKTGISVQIENMQYKTEDSEVQIIGEAKVLPPQENQKSINLVQSTNFNLKIKTKGEISEMINTLLLTNIDNQIKDTSPEIKKPEFIDDKFNLDLKYENNVLTINNFQAPTIVNYFIFNWLSTINSELGLESIDINTHTKEQEILSNMEEVLTKGLEIKRR